MYNTQTENLMQHTAECAFITHFLAIVGNVRFNKSYDADKLAAYALFHDASEVLTGDLPTPIKYYNEEMRQLYKGIEKTASEKLLEHLSEEYREVYASYLKVNGLSGEEIKLLKAADKLCAYIKCISEMNAGNKEFQPAYNSIRKELNNIESDELRYFLDYCMEPFSFSLDDLKGTL